MAFLPPIYLENLGTPAKYDRQVLSDQLQAGAVSSGDVKTTAGGGMNVSLSGGTCYVAGSQVVNQGLYRCFNDAAVLLAIAPAHASLPRIDQVIVRVADSDENGGIGPDQVIPEVVTGSPAAGATLDNRNGAASLVPYANVWRSSDVLIPAASSSVSSGNIRDRRTWARGLNAYIANSSAFSNGSNTYANVSGMVTRVELSGAPVEVSQGGFVYSTVANGIVGLAVQRALGPTNVIIGAYQLPIANSNDGVGNFGQESAPPAGSQLYSMLGNASAGNLTINSGSLWFRLRELIGGVNGNN